MAKNNIFGSFRGMTNMQSAAEQLQRLQNQLDAERKKQDLIDQQKKATTEWIWVEGYKGTDKDMKCRDYQYEFGKVHYMPTGAKIADCGSGFHLCKDLKDVFPHYSVGNGNRFFKVKALVKKADYEGYGKETMLVRGLWGMTIPEIRNKLTSSAIEFISELSIDEVLAAAGINSDGWTEEDKKIAMAIGTKAANENVKARELTAFGYSAPFARYLVGQGLYDRARTIGSQPGLSMDMVEPKIEPTIEEIIFADILEGIDMAIESNYEARRERNNVRKWSRINDDVINTINGKIDALRDLRKFVENIQKKYLNNKGEDIEEV